MCCIPLNKLNTMQLTKNFTLKELTATNKNVANNPNQDEIENLRLLCENVLQPIRDKFGYVIVSSGYRCPALNRAVGGSSTSQHVNGMAADIKAENMPLVYEWIKENLDYDQAINEFNFSWIHVSYDKDRNRKQALSAVKIGGKTVYV